MAFTHIDANGNAVMVDVSAKQPSVRTASASGRIRMSAECFLAVQSGTSKKGDVLGVAQVAGIMAAKHTADLIPLCHRLNLTKCEIAFTLLEEEQSIQAVCTVLRRPDRRGNGSPDRCFHRAAHHLRYV